MSIDVQMSQALHVTARKTRHDEWSTKATTSHITAPLRPCLAENDLKCQRGQIWLQPCISPDLQCIAAQTAELWRTMITVLNIRITEG